MVHVPEPAGTGTDPTISIVGARGWLAGWRLSLRRRSDLNSAERQPVISAAALPEEPLRLLMWGATMAWEARETRWE